MQVDYLKFAIERLRTARQYTRRACAPKSAHAISRAIKSVEGAIRHASRLDIQEKRKIAMGGSK